MLFKKFMNYMVMTTLIRRGRKALAEMETKSKNANQNSRDLLMRIINGNKDTEYGKKYHFAEIKTPEDYRKMVPFSNYDDYAPYIERVIDKGEKDLYTVYPIETYALSSGSVGVPKRVPVSAEALDIYSQYAAAKTFATCDNYYKEKTGKHHKFGMGLNTLEVTYQKTNDGKTLSGCISGAAAAEEKRFMPYGFTSPLEVVFPEETMNAKYLRVRYALAERNVTFMIGCFMTGLVDCMNYMRDHWEMLCDDIEKGIINPDIEISAELKAKLEKKIKADPKRAEELRAEFKKGFEDPIVPRIWKNMSWVSAVGTSGFKPYTEKMRAFIGPNIPIDFLAYAASEALMGATKAVEEEEYVLLPQSGFYEFIPENAKDETKTLTIDQLEVGKRYEIVLTNLSGFYRYRIKDVVEVTGYYYESPMVRFAYRKSQLINISGEKMTEGDLAWAIAEFAKETGIPVHDYAVYADTNFPPGRYIVLIESDKPVDMSKLDQYSEIIDKKMGEANEGGYAYERESENIAPAKLMIQQRESHALYREVMVLRGTSENQLKLVRVLDTPFKQHFFLKMVEEGQEKLHEQV